SQRLKQSMSACLMVSGFAAKPMVNLRSQIAHWQCTKTQKLLDGRALLGAQRTGRRLLRRLGHGLAPTILDEEQMTSFPLIRALREVRVHQKSQNQPGAKVSRVDATSASVRPANIPQR